MIFTTVASLDDENLIVFVYGNNIFFHVVKNDEILFSSIADVIFAGILDKAATNLRSFDMQPILDKDSSISYYGRAIHGNLFELLTTDCWLVQYENYRKYVSGESDEKVP